MSTSENKKMKTSTSKGGKKVSKKEAKKAVNAEQETPLVENQDMKVGGGDVEPVVVEEQTGGDKVVVEEQQAPQVVEEQSGDKKGTKTAAKKEKKAKKEKAAKKPRAKTAYNFFVSENMKELMKMEQWKDKKNSELMKECGNRWKGSSDQDKAPYQKLAAEAKAQLQAASS